MGLTYSLLMKNTYTKKSAQNLILDFFLTIEGEVLIINIALQLIEGGFSFEDCFVAVARLMSLIYYSSIVNVPGESTLRRDFIRLQQENKERSEALRRQQLLQEQQLREQEEYKRQLLAERQKRIEQQKEQRRRLEEVGKSAQRSSSRHCIVLVVFMTCMFLAIMRKYSTCSPYPFVFFFLSICPPLLALYSNSDVSER